MKQVNLSKLFLSIFLLFFLFLTVVGQAVIPRYLVRGKVVDARTFKVLKGIPITVLPFNKVVETNGKGAFLFNMPPGRYTLSIDYYPFDKQEIQLDVHADTLLMIEMHSPFNSQYIEEIEVLSSRPATENPAAMEQIDKLDLKVLPAMVGERDILKAFGLTAGVSSSGEGVADMQVRGGVHGQNLFLLDGIPMYSTQHFFGLVSTYNPTVIKTAKLYKSDFPAEYGGKISSIVNVMTDDANLTKRKGEVEIGMLSSKLAFTTPLITDKLALSVAGRLSNYSVFNIISPLIPKKIGTRFGFHFGDINANLVWLLSEKDRMKLTFFSNTDGVVAQNLMENTKSKIWMLNHQQNLGVNWYRNFSSVIDNHLLIYADNYGYDYGRSSEFLRYHSKSVFQVLTGIVSAGVEDKLSWKISDGIQFKTGVSLKLYGFSPIQYNLNDSNSTPVKQKSYDAQYEASGFAENVWLMSKNQTLSTGLRLSTMGSLNKTYSSFEPRFGYHGVFKPDFSISASASRMTQPVHRVANAGLGLPFEIFYPSSEVLTPERSWNFSVGMAKDIAWGQRKLSFKVDAWYKSLENVVEFKDGYDVLYSTLITPQDGAFLYSKSFLTQGNGLANGIDFSVDYSRKNFKLSADYCLMKAEYQFAELNNGRPFAAPTDIRHSLSVVNELKLSDDWLFTATWQLRSGKPITVPSFVFQDPSLSGQDFSFMDYSGEMFQRVETERNNYRTRPFHKLDVSFSHNYITRKHKRDATLSIGIYNVYNQANPFLYYIDGVKNPDNSYSPVLKSISLFPILPSFCWSMKF